MFLLMFFPLTYCLFDRFQWTELIEHRRTTVLQQEKYRKSVEYSKNYWIMNRLPIDDNYTVTFYNKSGTTKVHRASFRREKYFLRNYAKLSWINGILFEYIEAKRDFSYLLSRDIQNLHNLHKMIIAK